MTTSLGDSVASHTLLDERKTHVTRPNVLPIKGKAQEAKTFVAICTTKEVRENVDESWGGLLTRETEYVDTVEEREHIGRDDFVGKHSGERSPEELETL